MRLEIKLDPDPNRSCGDCQACCKQLPMADGFAVNGKVIREAYKPANTRCPFQKFHVGCKIYARRPVSCSTFSCRWLTNQDTADQQRPDRSHCVIDPMPDSLIMDYGDGRQATIQVAVIWVDPRHRWAFRNEPMRSYIERRGSEGIATLIRWDETDGVTVFPASITGTTWMEKSGVCVRGREPGEQFLAAAAAARLTPP